MSAVPAATSKDNLLEIPLIRFWITANRYTPFANSDSRREAKALLFRELEIAIRHRTPLDKALELNARILREVLGHSPANIPPRGADTRYANFELGYVWVLFLPIFLLNYCLYAAFAFRMTNVEGISRVLAMRLLRHVRKGSGLAEAMRRCGNDYTPQEVALVAAAESSGAMPDGLATVAAIQLFEHKISVRASLAWVPVLLAPILIFASYLFQRSYRNLLDKVPELTWTLPGTISELTGPHLLLLLTIAALPPIVLLFLRSLMNGTRTGKVIVLVFVAFTLILATVQFVPSRRDMVYRWGMDRDSLILVICIAYTIVTVVLQAWLLRAIEGLVNSAERLLERLLLRIPSLGSATGAMAGSRLLRIVAMGLAGGATLPAAVEMAAAGQTGRRRADSLEAAAAVAKGLPLSEALAVRRILPNPILRRLSIVENDGSLISGLRSLADEMQADGSRKTEMILRTLDMFIVLGSGIVVGSFVISTFYPVLRTPLVVVLME